MKKFKVKIVGISPLLQMKLPTCDPSVRLIKCKSCMGSIGLKSQIQVLQEEVERLEKLNK